ncbi:TetR family transcriptional regulator C-terminal domain-containing protein [Paenibacillus cellulositrophicus]
MKSIIRDGIQAGEFREDLDVDALASFAFSLLEGGILLSKLDGDNKHMLINITTFSSYLQQCCLKTR